MPPSNPSPYSTPDMPVFSPQASLPRPSLFVRILRAIWPTTAPLAYRIAVIAGSVMLVFGTGVAVAHFATRQAAHKSETTQNGTSDTGSSGNSSSGSATNGATDGDTAQKTDGTTGSTSNTGTTSGGSKSTGSGGAASGGTSGGSQSTGGGTTGGGSSGGTTSSWPDATNTGYAHLGISLTSYSGGCTLSGTVTIDSKNINCDIEAASGATITIKNSKVNGVVYNPNTNASITIQDTEVDGGTQNVGAMRGYHITMIRSNLYGGTGVSCWSYCTMTDSWSHGVYQPPHGSYHLNAFIANGGTQITLTHNTLACDAPNTVEGGGCSSNASLFGDFDTNTFVTFDHNLFVANRYASYCTYGGSNAGKTYEADHIVYKNNVFQKGVNGNCGDYGPVGDFNINRPGNVWTNNTWDDGTALTI